MHLGNSLFVALLRLFICRIFYGFRRRANRLISACQYNPKIGRECGVLSRF
jgi:hypothetical protein